MSSPQIPDPAKAPAIPDKVRTAAYIIGLVVGAVTLATTTTVGTLAAADVLDGTTALVVTAVSGGIGSVVGTIAAGLGVAYRPTR